MCDGFHPLLIFLCCGVWCGNVLRRSTSVPDGCIPSLILQQCLAEQSNMRYLRLVEPHSSERNFSVINLVLPPDVSQPQAELITFVCGEQRIHPLLMLCYVLQDWVLSDIGRIIPTLILRVLVLLSAVGHC